MKQAIVYGAGNIGRGFLAQLLQENQYQITFVDVAKPLIDRLQQSTSYRIHYIGSAEKVTISNFRAINSQLEPTELQDALQKADLILTAVGVKTLPAINQQLAAALNAGFAGRKTLMACENALRASSQWRAALWPLLTPQAQAQIQMLDVVVDRIVPGGDQLDLDVNVEEYMNLTVDNTQNRFDLRLTNAEFVDQLDFAMERKIFLVNALHCYTAWQGIKSHYTYIYEALQDAKIRQNVEALADELVVVLAQEHHVNQVGLKQYATKSLFRFANPHLKDKATRVGAGVLRKLASNERLITPFRYAQQLRLNVPQLRRAIKLGFTIKNPHDPEIAQRNKLMQATGYIQTITGLPKL